MNFVVEECIVPVGSDPTTILRFGISYSIALAFCVMIFELATDASDPRAEAWLVITVVFGTRPPRVDHLDVVGRL
jgi:hypothetical protein